MSTLHVLWTNHATSRIDSELLNNERKVHALGHAYLILHKYLDSAIAQQGKSQIRSPDGAELQIFSYPQLNEESSTLENVQP